MKINRRVLTFLQEPRDLTKACPLSLVDPKDFVQVADYNASGHQFHPVTDQSVVTELLGSVGLENTGDWDLVSLEGTERNQPSIDLFGNYNHYRHTLYVTKDVNTNCLESCFEFPGQTIPLQMQRMLMPGRGRRQRAIAV
jgi:hypothetical protein